MFNKFRRYWMQKFEKQSQKPLFALNERRHSSSGRQSIPRRHVKSSSSSQMKFLRQKCQEAVGKGEVDFSDGNEISDFGANVSNDGLKSSRLLTTAPLDASFTARREEMSMMPSRDILPPIVKRKYLSSTDISSGQPERQKAAANQHTVSFASQKSTNVQQDLDFDLEVTVDIESGKCVFHPKNEPNEPMYVLQRKFPLSMLILIVILYLSPCCATMF